MGSIGGYSKSGILYHDEKTIRNDHENEQNSFIQVFLNVQTERSWILSVLRGKQLPKWIRDHSDNRNSGTPKLFISSVILMTSHIFYLNI